MEYPNLRHVRLSSNDCFVAGDEEQFVRNVNVNVNVKVNNNVDVDVVDPQIDAFVTQQVAQRQHLFDGITDATLLETFRYIFYKFKKGIYVRIVDGAVRIFLPFSNVGFTNEWTQHLKVDPKRFASIIDLLEHIHNETNKCKNKTTPFKHCYIHANLERWYSNNGIFRYENPIAENETNVMQLYDMLTALCATKSVQNTHFFMNRRDFPLMTRSLFEPYYNLYNNFRVPIVSHRYAAYLPILSMCIFDETKASCGKGLGSVSSADFVIPNHNDWQFVADPTSNGLYKHDDVNDVIVERAWPFLERKPVCVFRGSNTGIGYCCETNARLKACVLSASHPDVLNAGITRWNTRLRKLFGNPYLQPVDVSSFNISLSPKLSLVELYSYRYLLVLDGHVSAFRLSDYLRSGSVVFLQDSPYKLWYSDFLQPYIHYIPVKSDLSNLIDQIYWARANDASCIAIVENARAFFNQHLSKEGILSYLAAIVNALPPLRKSRCWDFSNLNIEHIRRIAFTTTENQQPRNFQRHTLSELQSVPSNTLVYSKFGSSPKPGVEFWSSGDLACVLKKGKDQSEMLHIMNSALIGRQVVNNLLENSLNWAFTFGLTQDDDSALFEYIPGQSLEAYIQSDTFNMYTFLQITTQVMLAIQVAQEKYGFVHYDLAPKNIILQPLFEKTKQVTYLLSTGAITLSVSYCIPVIIDYGCSRAIVNDQRVLGVYNSLVSIPGTDVVTYIATCANVIIAKHLDATVFRQLLTFTNFLNAYTDGKVPLFKSARDLRTFTATEKKFACRINLERASALNYHTFNPTSLISYCQQNAILKNFTRQFFVSSDKRPLVNTHYLDGVVGSVINFEKELEEFSRYTRNLLQFNQTTTSQEVCYTYNNLLDQKCRLQNLSNRFSNDPFYNSYYTQLCDAEEECNNAIATLLANTASFDIPLVEDLHIDVGAGVVWPQVIVTPPFDYHTIDSVSFEQLKITLENMIGAVTVEKLLNSDVVYKRVFGHRINECLKNLQSMHRVKSLANGGNTNRFFNIRQNLVLARIIMGFLYKKKQKLA